MPDIINIHEADLKEEQNPRGETWRYLDLSGDRLGVRVEELSPGDTSSVHHFHTAEEEHVLVMEGTATLFLGSDQVVLGTGDHICFKAGKEEAHHIENTSDSPFRFLVFGERNPHDVVVYPDYQVMLVKGLGFKQITYRPIQKDDTEGGI